MYKVIYLEFNKGHASFSSQSRSGDSFYQSEGYKIGSQQFFGSLSNEVTLNNDKDNGQPTRQARLWHRLTQTHKIFTKHHQQKPKQREKWHTFLSLSPKNTLQQFDISPESNCQCVRTTSFEQQPFPQHNRKIFR